MISKVPSSPRTISNHLFPDDRNEETTQAEKRELSCLQSGSVTLSSVSHPSTDKEWGSKFPAQTHKHTRTTRAPVLCRMHQLPLTKEPDYEPAKYYLTG